MRTALPIMGFVAWSIWACGSSGPQSNGAGTGGTGAVLTGGTANGGLSTGGTAAAAGLPSAAGGTAGAAASGATPGSGGNTGTPDGGTGNTSAPSGGSSAVGGSPSGGAPASGGASGAPASGGVATGAAPGAGGAVTGGTPNTGGDPSTAGTPNTGGDPSTAGTTNTGGDSNTGGTPPTGGAPHSTDNLKDAYEDYFPIGAAVDDQSYQTHADVLKKHFNSITAENDMKFESLQPNEADFKWKPAEDIVKFATDNGMKVRGHALVWHRQNPAWLFSNGSGGNVSKEVLLQRMKTHIETVMRYEKFLGKVYVWDVVNEAIMEDGEYRTGSEEKEDQRSKWYEIIGESYIAEAFKYARAADSNAKLFYNDYWNYMPVKMQGTYDMLKGLVEQGVPIDGVGLQCHVNIEPSTDSSHQSYHQSIENLEAAIELYSSLGLEVQITEMDLSLYIGGRTYSQGEFYTEATFTNELKQQQADRYAAFFELFRSHADVITSVTFWGVADDNTWLSELSSGRKDFPLLFDTNHQAKPAYDAVVNF